VHSSERERAAMGIERRADRACLAFLLERELHGAGWDKRFQGEVAGLVGGGAFVRFGGELADVYDGFLPARLLQGDYYDLNETETALLGRRHGKLIRLGDPVSLRVTGVEAARGRVDVEPAGESKERTQRGKQAPGRRPGAAKQGARGSRRGRKR